ncbi:hypothetical protein BJ741DRAFT_627551 [Chytriomyces cf. hyalinus JEL632]|nr:hypothetical protein BJ741DRAFT_627551 [Chytriomyces cf. hyalinus JEL632]
MDCVRAAKIDGFNQVSVSVYSTFGLNECPQETWDSLTEADVAKHFGCRKAVLNGPRLWMVDSFGPAMSAPTEAAVAIQGLEVRHIATLSLTLMQALFLRGTYITRPMPRMVEFVWEAGSKAHFLVTPNGSQFIMQSISQKHLPSMNVDNGWKFETRVLESDVVVKTDAAVGHVLGLQDEFDNTYMYVGDVAAFAGVR